MAFPWPGTGNHSRKEQRHEEDVKTASALDFHRGCRAAGVGHDSGQRHPGRGGHHGCQQQRPGRQSLCPRHADDDEGQGGQSLRTRQSVCSRHADDGQSLCPGQSMRGPHADDGQSLCASQSLCHKATPDGQPLCPGQPLRRPSVRGETADEHPLRAGQPLRRQAAHEQVTGRLPRRGVISVNARVAPCLQWPRGGPFVMQAAQRLMLPVQVSVPSSRGFPFSRSTLRTVSAILRRENGLARKVNSAERSSDSAKASSA